MTAGCPDDRRQFGRAGHPVRRGRRGCHPAALNIGACFSEAFAKLRDARLLYKGRDFPETDVRPALTGTAEG
jgi:ribonuclease VapC